MKRRDFLKLAGVGAVVAATTSCSDLIKPEGTSPEKLIIDGDWGGDEMQLAATLLAQKDKVEVIGATTVFGNTGVTQAFENGRDILNFLKSASIKVYSGAAKPTDQQEKEGDNAHSENGRGGAKIEESSANRESKKAVDFILEQLRNSPEKTINITCTGPLTNIAEAFAREPETMKKVKQIFIMGGCTEDIPAKDIETRRGNITPQGEFNFFMAAQDAKTVMESGLPITLLPMNCTQDLSLTPERQSAIEQLYQTNPKVKNAIVKMMTAPAEFDKRKFGSSPFMHDVNVALFLTHPELYEISQGDITVSTNEENRGRTDFSANPKSNLQVATKLKDSDKAFDIFLESIKKVLPPSKIADISR